MQLTRKVLFIFIFSFLLMGQLSFAEQLRIAQGESYRLAPELKLLNLDRLVLEDNAVLFLNSGQAEVLIRAKNVTIGKNVSIIGTGQDGERGKDGLSHVSGAVDCQKPKDGGSGEPGAPGGDGVNLTLDWTINTFGSLTIDLSGGASGQGGSGGNGQDADQSDSCPMHRGGAAGQGGQSATSGSGGDLNFRYSSSEGDTAILAAKEATTVVNGAGASLESGAPGRPGKGSAGRYIKKKTLTGNRAWVAGGSPGLTPDRLPSADKGQIGRVSFQMPATTRSKPEKNVKNTEPTKVAPESMEQRVLLLEAKIKMLIKRVDQLEEGK